MQYLKLMKPCMMFAAFASSLLLCNCATIFGGATNRSVLVRSNPSGARVTITDKKGNVVHEGVTPTTASLKRASGYFVPASYQMTFKKAGYPGQTVNFKADINPWYFGNVVIGGLVGILVVDPLTGAMWTLDNDCAADLASAAVSNSGGQVAIVERSKVPEAWERHLVAVADPSH